MIQFPSYNGKVIREPLLQLSRMLKVKKVFRSFAEADKANREYYKSLTSTQRLDILLKLIEQNTPPKSDEAETRPKRIYRVIKRS